MTPSAVSEFVCPGCAGALDLRQAECDSAGFLRSGTLHCAACSVAYPVRDGIPRFVPQANYCESFGKQWNLHARTQLDKFNGAHDSRDRLYAETRWDPAVLRGQRILECGSGAGRFTQILLDAGARVCSLDYSRAVEANYASNGPQENLILVQGDIYRIPFVRGSFDKVLCFGVLQHTPDVRKSFMSMVPFLRPGGEIVVDVYPKHWRYLLHWKYLLRPLTTRMDQDRLYRMIEKAVPWLLPVTLALGRTPGVGRQLVRLVPVDNPEMTVRGLSPETMRQWSTLNTFDWFSPAYDQPQTLRTLRDWFETAGLEDPSFDHMAVYVGRGRRPRDASTK